MGFGLGQSQLFWDTIEATIIETLQDKIIYPSLTNAVPSPKGSSFVWNKISNQLSVETITTGTAAKNATLEFERKVLDLTEIGLDPVIYDNDINDSQWDVVAAVTNEVGKAFARKMNTDYGTAVNAAMLTALTSPSATAHTVAASARWNVADADILLDLKNAMDTSYADKGEPNALFMNPQDYTSLLTQPDFLRATAIGDKALTEGAIDKVFNLNIFTSTSFSRATVFGTHNSEATNYYEREAFTTEFARNAKARASEIVCWARYGFAVIRPEHNFKITGTYT